MRRPTGSGVRLALEVIPNPISDADALVTVIEEELDATDIGICLDSGHAFLMGDLVDAIEEVAGTSGHDAPARQSPGRPTTIWCRLTAPSTGPRPR